MALEVTKAPGVDGVTKATYGQNLEENLRALHQKLRQMSYRPQPVRRVEIPRRMAPYASWGLAASKTRSFRDDATDLGSHLRTGVYQDPMATVQGRVATMPATTNQEVMSQPVNWIVDLDLAQFFDTMPHLEILSQQQIKDRKLQIGSCCRVQTPGGCAVNWEVRKARLSPVLANIFLDQVLDQWFMTVVSTAEDDMCVDPGRR